MLFLIYLLKVSACLAVFYGLYFFAFRQFTFHTLNRFYLLCTLCLSFTIPLISFETTRVVKVEPAVIIKTSPITSTSGYEPAYVPMYDTQIIATVEPADETPDWRFYIIFCYITIASIMMLFLCAKLYRIYRLSRQAIKADNLRIVQRDGLLTNASFFNLIFLNTNGLTDNEKAQIIAHECVHIKYLHSIDVLLVEICKIILWFNPIIYFYKKSLVEVHEFEADLNTIQQFDSKNYAHLLLKLGINQQVDLTNQFSLRPLSTRIQFLFKKRTVRVKRLFYGLGLPLLALGIFAFAQRHEKLIYEATAKASEGINKKIASLAEALKSIETDSVRQEIKPLVSTKSIDSSRYKLIVNPFLLKTPEVPYPDLYNKTFYGGDASLIVRFRNTPEILSLDFFGDGKLITENTLKEDIHFFQEDRDIIQDKNFELAYKGDKELMSDEKTKIIYKEGKELIEGQDFEFIYEEGKIAKVRFKEYLVSPYIGLIFKTKQTTQPRPIKKDSYFPLKRQTPELNSPWRYKARINTQQNFTTDTLRTFMPANFLGKDPLVIINGREYHPRILQSLNFRSGRSYVAKPNDINAIEKYGIKAKDGVVDLKEISNFEFASEKERQVALENVRRELMAYELYKNDKIVKVRLIDNEGKEFERRVIRGFREEDKSVTIDLPLDGVMAYKIDGKKASEAEIISCKTLFTSSAYSFNDYYAMLDLGTK
ncbi:M56 family metallopeptidase [Emticicia sp. BO119]|uniref:M56 family metallopeptidase n=1 Tax=Emticicia sp. BO119 TaxID=2757768 RepID=UPI0015F11067|nr:M56 family metallopeptidase [Emticicia sp. BO119]MBA4854014.1 M56 family metallopeptidase [Emticicia sp. BO119]